MEFYCQNPFQSGDTTGLGIALMLFPLRHLMFLVNRDEIAKALPFLIYYRDLGVGPDRIHVVICDIDARALERSALSNRKDWARDQGRAAALPELDPKGAVRFKGNNYPKKGSGVIKEAFVARKDLLEKHLIPRIIQKQQRIMSLHRPDLQAVVARLNDLSRDVRVWDAQADLESANQLYQTLTNPDAPPPVTFRTFFNTDAHRYFHIGQSTEDIKNHVVAARTTAPMKRFHKVLGDGCPATIDAYAKAFAEIAHPSNGGAAPRTRHAGSGVPMVVLIWVRGLSATERRAISQANIRPQDITDASLAGLDGTGLKRNPHHVTTVQLYITIMLLLRGLSEQTGRRYIGIPIGDALLYDAYGPVDDDNRYLGRDDRNLIDFFTKCPEFQYDIAGQRFPNRVNQMRFLYKLLCNPRLAVMQVGIRSGGMEGGMYMGMPTIYLEEHFAPSGPRMAQMTDGGDAHAELDRMFLAAKKAANGDPQILGMLQQFRGEVQDAIVPNSRARMPSFSVELLGRAPPASFSQEIERILKRLAEGPPEVSPFPFFFRLVTRNLIGLNQVRSQENTRTFNEVMTGERPVRLIEERLLRGTLDPGESEVLRALIHSISDACPAYFSRLVRWTPQPLLKVPEYIQLSNGEAPVLASPPASTPKPSWGSGGAPPQPPPPAAANPLTEGARALADRVPPGTRVRFRYLNRDSMVHGSVHVDCIGVVQSVAQMLADPPPSPMGALLTRAPASAVISASAWLSPHAARTEQAPHLVVRAVALLDGATSQPLAPGGHVPDVLNLYFALLERDFIR